MGLNRIRANQIVNKDNVTKAEADPLGFNNNILLKTSSGSTGSASGFGWGFNEGTGTTGTPFSGSSNFTITSPTWGSGFVHSTNMTTDTATHALVDTSFSIAAWVELRAGSPINSSFFLELGTGDIGSYSNISFVLGARGNGKFGVFTSNGTTGNSIEVSSAPTFTTGVKYLCVMTYNRAGGASNNTLRLRITSDGSTWYETTNSSEVLLQSNPSFILTTISDSWTSFKMLTNYYKLEAFENIVLNDTQMQNIWDAGSEGDSGILITSSGSSADVTVAATATNKASLFINGDLYTNTSDASVTLSGTAGKYHIFATGGSGTFTLTSVADTASTPANSRFIGIVDWDGSQVTGIDSSLSSLIQKEEFSISATQATVTLNQFEYDTTLDTPLVYVNGMLENDLTLTDSKTITFPYSLGSGDMVTAVKLRNASTFSRPIVGPLPATPIHLFSFNEGSGSTVTDSIGTSNLTTNSSTWGSGYLSVDGTSQILEASNGEMHDLNDFSVASWVSFNALSNSAFNQSFLALGSGQDGGLSGLSFGVGLETGTHIPRLLVSDGSSGLTILTAGSAVSVDTKYLICITYKRNGGASNNIATIRWTVDGTTWNENSNSSAILMVQDASFELRNNNYVLNEPAIGIDAKYYEVKVFDSVISNTDMQNIWNAGSE
jgi:hypothetical protein